jgi:hypothetical protein
LAGLLLSAGMAFLAAGGRGADDDELKEAKKAQEDLIRMVDAMAKGGDGKKEAEAIHAKFDDVKIAMIVFRNSAKGGMPLGKAGPRDGIEIKIQDMDKKPLSKEEAAAQKDDLVKAARFARAMAQVAELYEPKTRGAEWKRYTRDMRKSAADLIEAARAGDPRKIKTAVSDLHASCTSCHSDFK